MIAMSMRQQDHRRYTWETRCEGDWLIGSPLVSRSAKERESVERLPIVEVISADVKSFGPGPRHKDIPRSSSFGLDGCQLTLKCTTRKTRSIQHTLQHYSFRVEVVDPSPPKSSKDSKDSIHLHANLPYLSSIAFDTRLRSVMATSSFPSLSQTSRAFPLPTIAEDTLHYTLHVPSTQSSSEPDSAALALLVSQYVESLLIQPWLWNKDGWELKVAERNVGSSKLEGRMRVGDAVDDEWVVVWVLREISRRWPELVIRSVSVGRRSSVADRSVVYEILTGNSCSSKLPTSCVHGFPQRTPRTG